MFEAYRVAVKLSLINDVSGGLNAITRHFSVASKDLDALQMKLDKLQKMAVFGAIGTAATGAGMFGLGAISKALKPAEEYTHQLNIMNMAGMKQAEIAEAVGAAWKLAGENMTTTATGNLKALLDLRNITGDWKEAKEFLPIMQRMETVLASSREGKVRGQSGDLAFSAMKALDIRGAVNDPERLKTQADMMTRVIEATQGRVTPEMFQSVFNYARQGKFQLSDDFAYKILPTMMLENAGKGGGGGGSRGIGPKLAALYRFTNQGFVNKKSLPLLKELGVLGDGAILPTATAGTVVAPLLNSDLAASNSFEWTKQTVLPKVFEYLKRHHLEQNDQNVLKILGLMSRGNQLAGDAFGEYYMKQKNFERDQKLIEGVMSPADAYKSAMSKDPATARRALHASWENFETSLMMNVVPIVVPALNELSKDLNTLGDWARHHPNMTKDLVIGFGAVSTALAVGGPLLTGLAITRLAFGGLGGKAKAAGEAVEGAVSTVSKLGTGIGNLTAAAAPLLAMLAVTKWAEDQTHDKERVATLQGWSNTAKSLLPDWMGDPTKKSMAKYMAARGELDGSGGDYVRPGASAQVHVTVNAEMDGEKITKKVTVRQGRQMMRPPTGPASHDGSMTPAPVGAGATGGW